MDERERYDLGMAQRRKVLGNAWVDRANALRPLNATPQPARLRWFGGPGSGGSA